LGEYVEHLVATEYGHPDYGNTRGRHDALCRQYPLEKVDWAGLKAALDRAENSQV